MRNWLRRTLGIEDLEGQLESFTQLRNLDRDAIRAIKDSADRNTQDMVAVVGDSVKIQTSSRLRALEAKSALWDEGMVRIATERIGELETRVEVLNGLLGKYVQELLNADAVLTTADVDAHDLIRSLSADITNLRQRLSLSVNRSELQALFRLKAALAKTAKGKLTPAERAALEAQ